MTQKSFSLKSMSNDMIETDKEITVLHLLPLNSPFDPSSYNFTGWSNSSSNIELQGLNVEVFVLGHL